MRVSPMRRFRKRSLSKDGRRPPRSFPDHIDEALNHRRGIAPAQCKIQCGFRLIWPLQASVCNAVHANAPDRRRHEKDTEACCCEAERCRESRRFGSKTGVEPRRVARDERGGKQSEPVAAAKVVCSFVPESCCQGPIVARRPTHVPLPAVSSLGGFPTLAAGVRGIGCERPASENIFT
jgi:hypothetical protein